MNRLVRFVLLLLLAFALISVSRLLAISRIIIMGILLAALVIAIIWVLRKAMKKP